VTRIPALYLGHPYLIFKLQTGDPDWGESLQSSVPPGGILQWYLELGCDTFRPRSFQFITQNYFQFVAL
jgi:hypothetical protein